MKKNIFFLILIIFLCGCAVSSESPSRDEEADALLAGDSISQEGSEESLELLQNLKREELRRDLERQAALSLVDSRN